MKYVYVLQHSHILKDCDETKFIGVFSSEKKEKKAKKKPGFKYYKRYFFIDKYPINKMYWKEGFIENLGIEVPPFVVK